MLNMNLVKVCRSAGTRKTYKKAEEYYEVQRPLFDAAARNYSLHWYFSHTEIPDGYVGWYDMISLRTRAMVRR